MKPQWLIAIIATAAGVNLVAVLDSGLRPPVAHSKPSVAANEAAEPAPNLPAETADPNPPKAPKEKVLSLLPREEYTIDVNNIEIKTKIDGLLKELEASRGSFLELPSQKPTPSSVLAADDAPPVIAPSRPATPPKSALVTAPKKDPPALPDLVKSSPATSTKPVPPAKAKKDPPSLPDLVKPALPAASDPSTASPPKNSAALRPFTNSVGMVMMPIPTADRQKLGDRGFYLAEREVTVGEYAAFVSATGYKTLAERDGGSLVLADQNGGAIKRADLNWREPGYPQTNAHPVAHVAWEDAASFCQWLAKKEKRSYRLPKEVEWEHACRAGSKSKHWFGDDDNDLATKANIGDRSFRARHANWIYASADWNDGHAYPSATGAFPANAWGLHDMLGNVSEWCEPTDAASEQRVLRGGCWTAGPDMCHAGFRFPERPETRGASAGFRIACDP